MAQSSELPRVPSSQCPICQKNIYDINAAVNETKSGMPAHFDCVLAKITEEEKPGPTERVLYIGGGVFIVADFGSNISSTKYVIKKRIQYEEKDKKPEWRKDLASPIIL